MKITPNKNLFWFIKNDAVLDLSNAASLEMYVQQVVSRGRTEDVKALLSNVDLLELKQIFLRIKRFLSLEVAAFWEHFLADNK